MKKMILAGCTCAIFLALGTGPLPAVAGDDLKAPETAITIAGKKPATFKHSVHVGLGLTCGSCHHDAQHKPLTEEAFAKLTDKSQLECTTCHNENFANKALQERKEIFHARCKNCHKTGYEGKNGPTKCSACHIKKAKKMIEGC